MKRAAPHNQYLNANQYTWLWIGASMFVLAMAMPATGTAQGLFAPPPLNPEPTTAATADTSNEQSYWALNNQQQFAQQSQYRRAQATQQQWQPVQATEEIFSDSTVVQDPTNQRIQQMPDLGPSGYPTPAQYDQFLGSSSVGQYGSGSGPESWTHQVLPDGLIYRSYLAGDRESRLRSFMFHKSGYGWLWDITLGGRVGLWRYGTENAYQPEGWQIDIEGAAMPRLDFEHDMNMVSADFRAGLPITYGIGPWQTKLGYYHLSSHLGDEQLLTFPGTPRYNYARDCLILGQSYYIRPELRIYAETAWAFYVDVGAEWEFQFGAEYAPAVPTGIAGAPFAAINGHLREESNFSGNLVVQAGWGWRDGPSARLFRLGLEYFNGLSDQFQFWNQFEEKIGIGLWYDY